MRNRTILWAIICGLVLVYVTVSAVAQTWSWAPAASMATPRYWHTATLLGNGKVLVVGGDSGNYNFVSSPVLYDPLADTWSPAGVMPLPRFGHNSRFGATIGGTTNDFFLLNAFALGTAAGPGPKKTIDVFVDRAVGGNPFKPFGTWNPATATARTLEYLGSFETLNRLGFTPDDICYSPQGAHLFIGAAADAGVGARGVFEVTVDGDLVESYALPALAGGYLGFAIDRVSSGPKVGHFFLAEYNGTPQIRLFEFDRALNLLAVFPVTGSIQPGDGIAYNQRTRTLAVLDSGVGDVGSVIEVTTNGEAMGSFSIPHVVGLTFNEQTGTYFGVTGRNVEEFSQSGAPIASYDLGPMGILGAVGIAAGQGKLYIVDECEPPNSCGLVHVLRLRGR